MWIAESFYRSLEINVIPTENENYSVLKDKSVPKCLKGHWEKIIEGGESFAGDIQICENLGLRGVQIIENQGLGSVQICTKKFEKLNVQCTEKWVGCPDLY